MALALPGRYLSNAGCPCFDFVPMYIRRSHRILIGIALVVATAVAVYAWRGPAVVDEVQDAAGALVKKASSPPPPTAEEQQRSQARRATERGQAANPAPATMRRCLVGSRILYTDEPCPRGSEEQDVPANLSVIPR